jgi:hypothetical protein
LFQNIFSILFAADDKIAFWFQIHIFIHTDQRMAEKSKVVVHIDTITWELIAKWLNLPECAILAGVNKCSRAVMRRTRFGCRLCDHWLKYFEDYESKDGNIFRLSCDLPVQDEMYCQQCEANHMFCMKCAIPSLFLGFDGSANPETRLTLDEYKLKNPQQCAIDANSVIIDKQDDYEVILRRPYQSSDKNNKIDKKCIKAAYKRFSPSRDGDRDDDPNRPDD